jgi:hypothetical protein
MPRHLPAKLSGTGIRARQCLQPYAQALITQRAQTAVCNRHHPVVLDRPKLEARVCERYAVVKTECDRLLPDKAAS